ncbi:MAG: nuclear transport factor 2 family protein [Alphaproteobacteria bacterium]|nr:nuclear transport factor 2 family protein [Alphaproteobacteria bacterium]
MTGNPPGNQETTTLSEISAESAARQATAALLRRYYEAFNSGDSEAMLDCLTDDVIHDVNQGERRQGKDKFHAFLARMAHHYEEKLDGITVLVSRDGARAAAEFNVSGKYLETEQGLPEAQGQTYKLPAGTFFAVRDGRIARVTTYYNLTEWIAQVAGEPV